MPRAEQIYTLIILSLVVASISWTVTQEEVFKEFHDYCARCSDSSQNLLARKFFYLFTCEYCFSHWVTMGVLIVSGFKLLFDDWRGYLVAFACLVWTANVYMNLYLRIRVDIRTERAEADHTEKKAGGRHAA